MQVMEMYSIHYTTKSHIEAVLLKANAAEAVSQNTFAQLL